MKTQDSYDLLLILGRVLYGETSLAQMEKDGWKFVLKQDVPESNKYDAAVIEALSPQGKQFTISFLTREV